MDSHNQHRPEGLAEQPLLPLDIVLEIGKNLEDFISVMMTERV